MRVDRRDTQILLDEFCVQKNKKAAVNGGGAEDYQRN